jgi:hypothetical protein
MADTVDTKVLRSSRGYYTVVLQNRSDGTGESDVTKVDISTLLTGSGGVPTYTAIERIDWAVWGFNYVLLEWDHTTDDEIATLAGVGSLDWTYEGGNVDPRSSGGTGDILLTTSGTTANSGYDITIRLRLK